MVSRLRELLDARSGKVRRAAATRALDNAKMIQPELQGKALNALMNGSGPMSVHALGLVLGEADHTSLRLALKELESQRLVRCDRTLKLWPKTKGGAEFWSLA